MAEERKNFVLDGKNEIAVGIVEELPAVQRHDFALQPEENIIVGGCDSIIVSGEREFFLS